VSDDGRSWDDKKVDQAFLLDAQVTEKIIKSGLVSKCSDGLLDIADFVRTQVQADELKGMEHFVSACVHVFCHPLDLRGAMFMSHTAKSARAKTDDRLCEWLLDKGTQRMRGDIMTQFGRKRPQKRSGF